jgi:hypothetical protein
LTMLLKVFRRKMTRMTTLDNLGRMERDIIWTLIQMKREMAASLSA